jgi:hypothetical protein
MFFRKALEQEAFRNTRRHKLIRNQPFLTHFSGFFINSFTQGNQIFSILTGQWEVLEQGK